VFEWRDEKGARLGVAGPGAIPQGDARIAFHALPADAELKSPVLARLWEFVEPRTGARTYATARPQGGRRFVKADRPVCVVWRDPLAIHSSELPAQRTPDRRRAR